jgi:hypothetical protein
MWMTQSHLLHDLDVYTYCIHESAFSLGRLSEEILVLKAFYPFLAFLPRLDM